MTSRKFTVVAQLHEQQNQELIEYVDSCFARIGQNHTRDKRARFRKTNRLFIILGETNV